MRAGDILAVDGWMAVGIGEDALSGAGVEWRLLFISGGFEVRPF